MKRKLYIHAGAGKTATTTIQTFLHQNAPELRARGCLYPQAGRQFSAHHPIAALFLPEPIEWTGGLTDAETIAALINEIEASPCDTVILSSEVFFYATRLSELKGCFERYDTRMVVYLRRQDEWLESVYRQDLKVGETEEAVEEFLKRRIPHGKYFSLMEAWAAVFGRNNVQAVWFNPRARGNPIEIDFLRNCAVDWSDAYEPMACTNERLNLDSLYFLALLPARPRYGPAFDQLFEWLADYSRDRPDSAEHKLLFSPQQRVQILEKLRAENVALAEHYLCDHGDAYLKACAPSVSEPWQPYSGLSAEKAIEVAWHLISRLLAIEAKR